MKQTKRGPTRGNETVLRKAVAFGAIAATAVFTFLLTYPAESDQTLEHLSRARGTDQQTPPATDTVQEPRQASTTEVPSADSDWFAKVQENIRQSEYNITWQDKCVIEGQPGGLHATNRANNLRAYFREDGVQIMPRDGVDSEDGLGLYPTAWDATGQVISLAQVQPTAEGNQVIYGHSVCSSDTPMMRKGCNSHST